jgi:NADPH:quinone reductase-like Zn-dependent oxidoreductase
MKAIVYHGYGDESVLRLEEVPEPKISADRALVKVKAAGVNPVDYHVRNGAMDPMLDVQFPVTPGWDVAGVVDRVGYLAEGFSKGDEVMGYAWMDFLHHGSYAEYMAAPLRTLVHKPESLSWDQAAALPLAGLTAYQAIKRVGVAAGDVVLAHGAAGGIGSIGVQILRLLGATVIGTASPSNHDFLRGLGAVPVGYGDDLHSAVREHAPDGVDVIADFYGHGSLERTRDLLRAGRTPTNMVTVADGRAAMAMGAHVIGVQPVADDLQQLADWAVSGALTVPITQRFPLAEAADAHRLSASGHTRGKIVIEVDL